MPLLKRFRVFILFGGLFGKTVAQTWCGKHYMASQSSSEPGGEFPEIGTSSEPLLALRCAQAIRPYLPADTNSDTDPTAVSILIDTSVTFRKVNGSQPITLPSGGSSSNLQVTVTVDGKTLTSGEVPLNSTKQALPFSLSSLSAQTAARTMTCTATLSGQTFTSSGLLSFLPDPPSDIGSVTKLDARTGALLARPANGNGGDFAPVFPIGFYTQFNSYLAKDLSISATLAKQGFTVVHPVPDFSNTATLDAVLDKMQEAGLYLMYDMRNTYMNSSSVRTQVNHIKSRPNLLLWYTADEPDGTSDPLDATVKASNLITSLDGGDGQGGAGYHPVSLVLNCQNFHFTEYTAGSDIVLQDAYMVSNNVTFSTEWHTPCNTTYGDCGCDNCKGSFKDISDRMDTFKDRLFVNGWETTKAVWTVPQGFGNETYWKRFPTGKEFVIESVVGINHGGVGVVSWDDPTSDDIKSSASTLALAMPKMSPFILHVNSSFQQTTLGQVDIGLWSFNGKTLVLGANMDTSSSTVDFSQVGLTGADGVDQVLDSGATADVAGSKFMFDATGSGAWIVNTSSSSSQDPNNPDVNTTNNANASLMKNSLPILLTFAYVVVHMTFWRG